MQLSSDQWTLATGQENAKPVIYRIRLLGPGFAAAATFPHLLVVLWPFDSPNEMGLPAPDDLERMSELENLLRPAFEEAQQGFLAVIVTGDQLREWQYYVRDPEATMELVNTTLAELAPFPVEFRFQDDPEWSVYWSFLELTGPTQGGL